MLYGTCKPQLLNSSTAIRIGFEEASYTFAEPSSPDQYNIYLAKEGGVVSEQTFFVGVNVSRPLPPGSPLQPALLGRDYLIGASNNDSFTVVTLPPFLQRAPFIVTLLPDNVTEGDEGFIASLAPSGLGSAPTYLNPIGLAAESLIVISSRLPPVGEWKWMLVLLININR